jgi:hypothetical protein
MTMNQKFEMVTVCVTLSCSSPLFFPITEFIVDVVSDKIQIIPQNRINYRAAAILLSYGRSFLIYV